MEPKVKMDNFYIDSWLAMVILATLIVGILLSWTVCQTWVDDQIRHNIEFTIAEKSVSFSNQEAYERAKRLNPVTTNLEGETNFRRSRRDLIKPKSNKVFITDEYEHHSPSVEAEDISHHLRIFGHLQDDLLEKLRQSLHCVELVCGDYLFEIGDDITNLYIVETGELEVTRLCKDLSISEPESIQLKRLKQGECIFSLLNFIDCLLNINKRSTALTARALKDSRVLVLPFEAMKDEYIDHPRNLSKVIQSIMARFQRVNLVALHQYLGIGTELFAAPVRSGKYGLLSHITSPLRSLMPERSVQQWRDHAKNLFISLLGLSDSQVETIGKEFLDESLSVIAPNLEDVIQQESSRGFLGLGILLQGELRLQKLNADKTYSTLQKVLAGGVINQLQVLTDDPSFYGVVANSENVRVAYLATEFVNKAMENFSSVTLRLAQNILEMISPLVRSVEFCIDWFQIESGRVIYKQGEPADSTIIILSGRLRAVMKRNDNDDAHELVTEYGRGDLLGLMDTLKNSTRKTTVLSVRDSDVAKIPHGVFELFSLKFPRLIANIIKLKTDMEKHAEFLESGSETNTEKLQTSQESYSTVALLPITKGFPMKVFCSELLKSLLNIDTAGILSSEIMKDKLGLKGRGYKVSEFFGECEDQFRITLFECDEDLTLWTQLAMRHADLIIFLTASDGSCEVSKLESSVQNSFPHTRKELVILHPEGTLRPRNSSAWLENRGFIQALHHMIMPIESLQRSSYQDRIDSDKPDVHSDFSRLARNLMGCSICVVLGGGGARGCAHVGIIAALLQSGIPIDRVCGVSMGALVGITWCLTRDLNVLINNIKYFAIGMKKKSNFWLSATFPYTAYTTGWTFNEAIKSIISDSDIADCWIPFFTVTTDINTCLPRIHDIGSAWRYVRASMTLAYFLPPLCDPTDGHLLMDGGYTNNLPADEMKKRGANHIIAVDVGSEVVADFDNFHETLNGFRVLLSKWVPFVKEMKVPSSFDIMARLSYSAGVQRLDHILASKISHLFRPPINHYATMEFEKFDEIKDIGYHYGIGRLTELKKKKAFPEHLLSKQK